MFYIKFLFSVVSEVLEASCLELHCNSICSLRLDRSNIQPFGSGMWVTNILFQIYT